MLPPPLPFERTLGRDSLSEPLDARLTGPSDRKLEESCQPWVRHRLFVERQQTPFERSDQDWKIDDWRSGISVSSAFGLLESDATALIHYDLHSSRIKATPSRTLVRTSLVDEEVEELRSVLAGHAETLIVAFRDMVTIWDVRPRESQRLEASSLSARALDALKDIQELLGLSMREATELVGISRNTPRNWRAGGDTHPGKVRRLFDVANLLRALRDRMGTAQLAAWLNEVSLGGESARRDLLGDEEGPARLAREAADVLFPAPRTRLPAPEWLGVEEDPDDGPRYAPHLFDR